MSTHNSTAAPIAVGSGGNGYSKGLTPYEYRNPHEIATAEYAAVKLANRFRLQIETARVVCHLAGIGGTI